MKFSVTWLKRGIRESIQTNTLEKAKVVYIAKTLIDIDCKARIWLLEPSIGKQKIIYGYIGALSHDMHFKYPVLRKEDL